MATLRVLLNDLPVGELSLNSTDGADFRLFDSYKAAYPRPVLGQVFLDDLERIHHVRGRTPPWFSNLLPEGMLRDLVARQAGGRNRARVQSAASSGRRSARRGSARRGD